jgi:uncharacterized protein
MIRCVLDTNVIISGALFEHSVPAQVLFLVLRKHTILASQATLFELSTVLRRKRFDRYIASEDRERFLTRIALKVEIVSISEHITACRDSKDNKFLDVAVNGSATVLISGDEDLLSLHPFQGISIITPREFIDQVHDAL